MPTRRSTASARAAFLAGYEVERPLEDLERELWPVMLRRAALRTWLGRLGYSHFPRDSHMTIPKDHEFSRRLLEHHIAHAPPRSPDGREHPGRRSCRPRAARRGSSNRFASSAPRPIAWIGLCAGWIAITFALLIIPFVGGVIANFLQPAFFASFAHRGATSSRAGERIVMGELFGGFRRNRRALRRTWGRSCCWPRSRSSRLMALLGLPIAGRHGEQEVTIAEYRRDAPGQGVDPLPRASRSPRW